MAEKFKLIRCRNHNCKKVVGEVAEGKARFKCRHCDTYTIVNIKPTAAEQIIRKMNLELAK